MEIFQQVKLFVNLFLKVFQPRVGIIDSDRGLTGRGKLPGFDSDVRLETMKLIQIQ